MKKIGLILMCALFVYADLNPKTEIFYNDNGYEYELLQTNNENLNIFLKNELLNFCGTDLLQDEFMECYENIKNIDIKKYVQNLVEDMENAHKEEVKEQEFDFSLSVRQSFVSQKGDLVQIRQDSHQYAGGAHGMEYSQVFVYDISSDHVLHISEILVSIETAFDALYDEIYKGYINFISTEWYPINEKCNKVCQDKEIKEFVEFFWDRNSKTNIICDPAFYFSDEGLTFIYEPYAIAPYAAGMPEIVIPYENLKGIVKDEYLKF